MTKPNQEHRDNINNDSVFGLFYILKVTENNGKQKNIEEWEQYKYPENPCISRVFFFAFK